MQRADIVAHHLDLIDLLVDVAVTAEPSYIVDLLFKIAEPDFCGAVDSRHIFQKTLPSEVVLIIEKDFNRPDADDVQNNADDADDNINNV